MTSPAQPGPGDPRALLELLSDSFGIRRDGGSSSGSAPSPGAFDLLEEFSEEARSVILDHLQRIKRKGPLESLTDEEAAELVETLTQCFREDVQDELTVTRPRSSVADGMPGEALSELSLDETGLPQAVRIPDFNRGPFAILPAPMQEELRSHMTAVRFDDDQLLFEEGTPGDCLYLVTSGTVAIWGRGLNHRLGSVTPGQIAGEMALMGMQHRTADALAEGPVTALRLGSDEFRALCERHPPIAHAITHVIADRLGQGQYDAFCAKSLHGYTIQQRLGRGGMAVVYDAEHAERRQRVALKMMSHRLVFDHLASEWFRREAMTVSRFDHPNIPRLIETFDGFGTIFIALEFIEGENVKDLLQRSGPLSEDEALHILVQLSRALSYAHDSGIVHRDVKPQNVMITPDRTVKLMDFGLAIPWQGSGERLTAAGTLPYMAPEQIFGDPPQPACDWFSFGCFAFELVTGQRLMSPRRRSDLYQILLTWNLDQILARIPAGHSGMREILSAALQMTPIVRMETPKLVEKLADADD
jgi:CRP-like cAMP-binding protein